MTKFQELILEGERIRETQGLGGPEAAIPIFREALQDSDSTLQDSEAIRHLALCFEHLGQLDEAIGRYNQSYILARESTTEKGYYSAMARAKRHISSCLRKQGKFDDAFRAGLEAHDLMVKEHPVPTDIVWVVHGIVDAVIDAGNRSRQAKLWLREEYKAVRYMMPREDNPLRRRVWLTGFLIDVHKIYGFWGWPAKALAQIIAYFGKLGLRSKQLKGQLK